jgi:hypothetical protein
MAGATTSRVVFISSSASHSNTFWMICGLGFCRSWVVKLMPMSVMQPAISVSGYVGQYVASHEAEERSTVPES